MIPNQTKPNQTKPNQTKPNLTKPNQTTEAANMAPFDFDNTITDIINDAWGPSAHSHDCTVKKCLKQLTGKEISDFVGKRDEELREVFLVISQIPW